MCKAFEEVKEEGRQEAQRETAARMLAFGKNTLEEISALSGFPLDEVKKLQAELNPT